MRFTKPIAAGLALAVVAVSLTGTAEARHRHRHGDAFAAGILGFTAGAILSGAFSQPRYYHRPYYAEPVYVAPPPPPVVYDTAPAYYYARPEPWTAEWYDSCRYRYRSFNSQTGYFLGYDGDYHFCY